MVISVDPDQTAPIGAVCSWSTLFASILNSSVMLGNYLQQTTSADDIFKCILTNKMAGYLLVPIRFVLWIVSFFDRISGRCVFSSVIARGIPETDDHKHR